MLLMDYAFTTVEDFPDHDKHDTWNLLHTYIDAHIQSLMYKYPGYVVQAITRL